MTVLWQLIINYTPTHPFKKHTWKITAPYSPVSHKEKTKNKTHYPRRRQSLEIAKHSGFSTVQIPLTDFFLVSWERKAAELAHGTGALPVLPEEQLRSIPRSVSTPCLLHPSGQHRRRGGGDALRRAGARSRRERAGSTSPGPGPTQPIRGWLSGNDAALRSPNSPKTGSSRPEMGATCAARLCRCVSKEDSGEQTTRSPFSCRLRQWLHGKFKGGGGDHIFCYLKRKSFLLSPGNFYFFVSQTGNLTSQNDRKHKLEYQEL